MPGEFIRNNALRKVGRVFISTVKTFPEAGSKKIKPLVGRQTGQRSQTHLMVASEMR